MRVWSRKSAINQVDYALQQGVDILEYFENFFDEPFPLPKTGEFYCPFLNLHHIHILFQVHFLHIVLCLLSQRQWYSTVKFN